jgi:signal transduction histidine kinase
MDLSRIEVIGKQIEEVASRFKRSSEVEIEGIPESFNLIFSKDACTGCHNTVLSALMDNAIKYCVSKPIVTLFVSNSNDNSTIRIADNGIGIAPREQRRVFDKFYRVSQGNRHDTKGYGLGLYYVRNIVERHGGKIAIRSALGKGTEFEITLPMYD